MTALHTHPTIGNQILRALRTYPQRLAFSWDGGELSYEGAEQLIVRMQQVLLQLELEPQSRVALLSSNRADVWCAAVAAQLSRLATVWLHPAGSIEDQLFQIEDSDSRVLIIDSRTYGDHGGDLAARVDLGVKVFTLGPSDYGVDLIGAAELAGSAVARCYARADDLASFNYSGGTTGRSKAAVRRHRQVAVLPATSLLNLEHPRTPVFLAVGPISHATGHLLVPSILRGGTVHLAADFDPGRVLQTIERERINSLLLVPSMIYTLLDDPALSRVDLSSIEMLLYAASPMSPSRLAEGLDRIGPVFSQLYGLTECAPITMLRSSDHDVDRPDLLLSCGTPAIDAQVVLLDADDQEVPVGEVGEICVRSPVVMDGYWRQPEQTAEAFRGGWLHTGDMARADERGFLYILDRKKDMIVTGGFNVYPREVEDVLMQHPAVAAAAVIGTPHDKWGEAVTAVVVLREHASLSEQAVIELVRSRKGPVQAPKSVMFVDALPLTGVGKIDKRQLRAQFWSDRTRAVG